MKTKIYLIFFIICLSNCDKEQQININYSSDLEERNLFGKVKSYSLFRAEIKNFDLKQTENFTIEMKEEFTKKGQISLTQYFDSLGEPLIKVKKIYFNNCVKIIDSQGTEIVCTIKDSINGIEHLSYSKNDHIKYQIIKEFDNYNNIERKLTYSENNTDTLRVDYLNKYDSKKNLIRKEQITDSYSIVTENKYNEEGKLIETISDRTKETIIYKDNRISEIDRQSLMAIPYQWQITTGYDQYFNETFRIWYKNFELYSFNRYKYKLDERGNWIENIIYSSNSRKEQNFKPIFIERREIEYWE